MDVKKIYVISTETNLTPGTRENIRREFKERTGEDCIVMDNGLKLQYFPMEEDEGTALNKAPVSGHDMRPYRIRVRAVETRETPEGDQRNTKTKIKQTIMASSFRAAIKYVQETFNSENVTITSLKIKEVS